MKNQEVNKIIKNIINILELYTIDLNFKYIPIEKFEKEKNFEHDEIEKVINLINNNIIFILFYFLVLQKRTKKEILRKFDK